MNLYRSRDPRAFFFYMEVRHEPVIGLNMKGMLPIDTDESVRSASNEVIDIHINGSVP